MKNIILIILALLLFTSFIEAQVKVDFSLQNGRIENDKVLVDLYATVPMGQTWNVGPTCIRLRYWTEDPPNAISLVAENPASNANTNLSGNTNYSNMTTTSIMNDTACSLNMFLFNGKTPHALTTGAHWLGSIKFNILTPGSCINMSFLEISAVFDNLTGLTYGTQWTKTDPPPCIISGISLISTEIPSDFKLGQNYPNPFNPVTKINFAMAKTGFVTIKVYDILGRTVATLVNEKKDVGTYIVDFDASSLNSGVYFYRMETEGFTEAKRMVVIK